AWRTCVYKDLFDLSGKVAVVTGGVGILGTHFCRALAEFGANVAVVDLDEEKARAAAAELTSAYGTKCLGVACDVADPASVTAMVDKVVSELGGIDVLHNNAASKS